MEKTCPHPDCIAPKGKCNRGLEIEKCPYFGQDSENVKKQTEHKDGSSISWSGIPFGLEDLSLIAGRNRPRVIGVLGPHKAGKTTLLGMTYSHLWHGKRFGDAQFAGSYTFAGWENIAIHLRWNEESTPSSIPPPYRT